MRITTTLAAAASIAVLSTSAFAGGMSEEVMEAPVVMEEMAPAPAGSGTAGIIALGVLAAILLYAASEE
ncbi:hypothetical protein N9824_00820 [bacterium]|jgi:hypothetical protein|uniref:hypothetical protein n=1 Tax=Yoonia sp. TaxID=2212373 RepID=UPI00236C5431|nr:hypothetical protein [Yoonia sp.]MDB4111010.1 hypothetical protein [Yoonia sp.]MDB4246066.1 hypothetical protein [bacterium]